MAKDNETTARNTTYYISSSDIPILERKEYPCKVSKCPKCGAPIYQTDRYVSSIYYTCNCRLKVEADKKQGKDNIPSPNIPPYIPNPYPYPCAPYSPWKPYDYEPYRGQGTRDPLPHEYPIITCASYYYQAPKGDSTNV